MLHSRTLAGVLLAASLLAGYAVFKANQLPVEEGRAQV
jgi:hypothetical protein